MTSQNSCSRICMLIRRKVHPHIKQDKMNGGILKTKVSFTVHKLCLLCSPDCFSAHFKKLWKRSEGFHHDSFLVSYQIGDSNLCCFHARLKMFVKSPRFGVCSFSATFVAASIGTSVTAFS